MSPTRKPHHRVRLLRRTAPLALGLLTLLGFALIGGSSSGDDRDLLRKTTSKPHIFVLLDSSASMALGTKETDLGNDKKSYETIWTHAGGDDPRSRLYQARQALYEVFRNKGDDYQFAFAHINQDQLRVESKHYLYYVTQVAPSLGWPLAGYPAAMTASDITDTVDNMDQAFPGDMMTLGRHMLSDASVDTARSCDPSDLSGGPLLLDGDREAINRFPKLHTDGAGTTYIWVEDTKGDIYRLKFTVAGGSFGDSSVQITVIAEADDGLGDCDDNMSFVGRNDLTLGFWREFLLTEGTPADLVGTGESMESVPSKSDLGWEFADFKENDTLYLTKPFSGGGWEGNYDTDTTKHPQIDETDEWCEDSSVDGSTQCTNLKYETTTDTDLPSDEELDLGDVIPLHWKVNYHTDFMERINPVYDPSSDVKTEFGAAPLFEDLPNAGFTHLQLDQDEPPLIPAGSTPLGSAMSDVRCYYTGGKYASNKCDKNFNSNVYDQGFMRLSFRYDEGNFLCRNPYMIVITDGEVTGGQTNDPTSVVSDLQQTSVDLSDFGGGKSVNSFMKTWVINMGIKSMRDIVNPGGGEEVRATNTADLKTELNKILGEIEETSRTFAAAAVPSVQTSVADKLYITNFTPIDVESVYIEDQTDALKTALDQNQSSVWEGHANAFIKPVKFIVDDQGTADPADDVRFPDTTPDPDLNPNFEWDVGSEDKMLQQALDKNAIISSYPLDSLTDLNVGYNTNGLQRRVYYAEAQDGDVVPRGRQLLAPPSTDFLTTMLDQWKGLGIVADTFTPLPATAASVSDLLASADADTVAATKRWQHVLTFTYMKKYADLNDTPTANDNTDDSVYILGDTFHANPQVVGPPENQAYLANAEDFPGYLTFSKALENRRRFLLLGTNDGMLHAINAGVYREKLDDSRNPVPGQDPDYDGEFRSFDDDGGLEVWAYAPRATMSGLKRRAEDSKHVWGVDGPLSIFDALIDISHSGTPADADREWRTVVVGALRRGGPAYYALDITQPEPMKVETAFDATAPDDADKIIVKRAAPDKTYRDQALPPCINKTGTADNRIGIFFDPKNYESCDSTVEYPTPLWEFIDDEFQNTCPLPVGGLAALVGADGEPDDLDCDGDPDLGQTWSKPNAGAIRVEENGKPVKKFVAIFGGGWDPDGEINRLNKADKGSGNYIYIVDVETGKWLFKYLVDGSVPAEPAAVDTDQDGFLDRVYFVTTAGFVYRLDIDREEEVLADGTTQFVYPKIDATLGKIDATAIQAVRSNSWIPYKIFDTFSWEVATDGSTEGVRRRIFFRPAVFFVADLSRYALAFGTGNRDDLWGSAPTGGNRVYTFVDDFDLLTPAAKEPFFPPLLATDPTSGPMMEKNPDTGADILQEVTLSSLAIGSIPATDLLADDNLTDGERGWYVKLLGRPDWPATPLRYEKLVTQVTNISGLTTFATYLPWVTSENSKDLGIQCARHGYSLNYLMLTTNGTSLNCDTSTCDPPEIGTGSQKLASEPFIQPSQTANEPCKSSSTPQECDPCLEKGAIAERLKELLYPTNCKYSHFGWDINQMGSDTSYECIVRMPVCMIEANWKDY